MSVEFDGSVLIETDVGIVVVDVCTSGAPLTVTNFIRLCEIGCYRNTLIYHIETDFVACCGDESGTGKGGTSFDELSRRAGVSHREIGEVPALEAGNNVESIWTGHILCALQSESSPRPLSQFFFTLSDASTARYSHLKMRHTVIGRVAEDVSNALPAMSRAYVDDKGRPLRDIRIRKTTVLVYPPSIQPLPENELLAYSNLLPHPDIDVPKTEWDAIMERPSLFTDVMANVDEETAEARKQKLLAESRAIELEILGDLTSADAKPQDNVLFVCKLNPVTKSEDLKIIFSRFGEVTDCEVKRDPETKESLQYAFIAFATREECEEAYRKMQDVVIDGRRIRVDFSQSEGKKKSQIANFQTSTSSASRDPHNRPQEDRRRRDRSPERRATSRDHREGRRRDRHSSDSSSGESEEKRHRKKRSRQRRSDSDSDSDGSHKRRKEAKKKHKGSKKSHKSSRQRSRSRERR
jgi:peptidyl-prolyl cis-trans isomerase-like 4